VFDSGKIPVCPSRDASHPYRWNLRGICQIRDPQYGIALLFIDPIIKSQKHADRFKQIGWR
jgi:hypothetical protein